MSRFPSRLCLAVCTLAVLTTACASTSPRTGSTRPVPRPFPMPAGTPDPARPPDSTRPPDTARVPDPSREPDPARLPDSIAVLAGTIVNTALTQRGVPYRNGGSDPGGFDCSGFTQWVFAQNGILLPRAVEEQYQYGKQVNADDLESGDLVFFRTVSNGPSHVGIVIGGDQFIHAPSSKGVVRVEHLSTDYWSRRFIAARRMN